MSASREPNVSEKRLERACNYVEDLWFPANPSLLNKIKHGVHSGYYDDAIEILISEIRSDYALFMYCLRELSKLLEKRGVSSTEFDSPFDILRRAGIDQLKQILDVDEHNMSRHLFESVSDSQKARFREVVISSSAAQVLAKHSQVNPELGFSAALIRQLGYTLIAWNYPRAYERALELVREGESLDVAISRQLGFSPSMLAIRVTRRWGLALRFTNVFDETSVVEEEDVEMALYHDSVSASVAELCRVGEALARANDPQHYPSAGDDWELAQMEIERRLGPKGLELVQEAVEENSENYIASIPHFFEGSKLLDPEEQLREHVRTNLLSDNVHIRQCRPLIRAKLEELYRRFSSGISSHEALLYLMKDIVPACGISGGCVFTVDPSLCMLVPQLRIGNLALRPMRAVQYNAAAQNADFVSLAYISETALVREAQPSGETKFVCMASAFGLNQRSGVLYAEIPQAVYDGDSSHHLSHFNAVTQALNHCLSIDVLRKAGVQNTKVQ